MTASIAVVAGVAVATARFLPALALALMGVLAFAKPVLAVESTVDQVALAVVAYHCGRHGGRGVVWLSGLYVPAAYLLGGFYVVNPGTDLASGLASSGRVAAPFVLVLQVLSTAAPLALPWLLGVSVRLAARARANRDERVMAEAQAEAALARQVRAEAVAAAQQEQADLARDVHDVVGHSLAVILAQAESAAYLAQRPSQQVLDILDNIASCARTSLEDVRQVLAPERTPDSVDPADDSEARSLDRVIQRLPQEALALDDRVIGAARPLAPDTAVAAQRLLQEMLTNALRHGVTGRPVRVVRDWTDGLRIEVTNAAVPGARGSGLGVDGMRRRASAVGGLVDVEDDGDSYTVRARLPLGSTAQSGRS